MDFRKMMHQEEKTKKRNRPRRKKRSQSSPTPRPIPQETLAPPSNRIQAQRTTDWATGSTVAPPRPTSDLTADPLSKVFPVVFDDANFSRVGHVDKRTGMTD